MSAWILLIVLALDYCSSVQGSAGTLGFALGNKRVDGSCKSTADYREDLHAIKENSGSEMVRLYSAAECDSAAQLLPAARAQGFKVLLGVWPDTAESFAKDKLVIASRSC